MTGQDSTRVELIALQTVGSGVVIQTIGKATVFVTTIDHNTCHTAAGRNPHIMILVFSNTADVVIAKTLLLSDMVEIVVVQVVVGIQHVQSFARTHPDESTRVFGNLSDIVVCKLFGMCDISCEYTLLSA